jgi:hypothetical protein
MKTFFLRTSLALLALAATASADLSLAPRLVTVNYGAYPVRRAYFMDGDKKFAVTMDSQTELAPRGDGALFTFTKIPLGTMEFRRSPFKPGAGFTEENISTYAKAAREMLASTAEIWPEEPMQLTPFRINGWKSCRFNFVYRVGGSPVRADVTFIDLNEKQQIVIICGGQADTYSKVRDCSEDIIRRWHEVTPEEELGLN